MGFTIKGTKQQRATIEGWLREICVDVSVDPTTGEVTAVGPAPGHRTGCDCLRALISSRRSVTVTPLPRSSSCIPGLQPAKAIERCGGGSTVPVDLKGATDKEDGTPGQGRDGNPGSDTNVFIDFSGKAPKGYKHGYPMWLVLAHELTTGHATHAVTGKLKRRHSEEEYTTIACEHAHVTDHNGQLLRRDPNHPNKRLKPEDPVPPYVAPPREVDDPHEDEGD